MLQLKLLFALFVLLSLGCLLMAVRRYRRRRAEQVADELEAVEGSRQAKTSGGSGGGLGRLGALLRPKDEQEIELLKSRVVRAGLTSRDAVDLFITLRWSFLIGMLVVALLLMRGLSDPMVMVLTFVGLIYLGVRGPSLWLEIRTRSRQQQIARSLPSTLDLLVTCLEAGLAVEQALDRVSAESRSGDDLFAAELRITLAELRAGLPLALVFRRLAARIGLEDVNTLAAVITQATTLGANITDVLRNHAASMRQHRMAQLEEKAGKANAKLTLPLSACLLPAVLVVLLGPAFIMMFRMLF